MAYNGTQSIGRLEVSEFSNLIGRVVRINRGGPDSVEGLMLAVKSDYVVILAKDGIVFIPTAHIKSITVKLEGSSGRSIGSSGGSSGGKSRGLSPILRDLVQAANFHDLLVQLKHRHVRVNRGGPEKVEGILENVTSDSIDVIMRRELVRILISHIKSVTLPFGSGGKSGGKKQSGGAKRTSGGAKRTSGGMKRTSGGAKRTSGGMKRTSGGVKRTSGGMQRTSGGVKRTSGGMQRTSGGVKRTSGGMHRTSGGAKRTSGGVHRTGGSAPRNVMFAPFGAGNAWDPFPMS